MNVSCAAYYTSDQLNYERYISIAEAINDSNIFSFGCFSAMDKSQQELLISKIIAKGFQFPAAITIVDAGGY
jgi:hypothetical protein